MTSNLFVLVHLRQRDYVYHQSFIDWPMASSLVVLIHSRQRKCVPNWPFVEQPMISSFFVLVHFRLRDYIPHWSFVDWLMTSSLFVLMLPSPILSPSWSASKHPFTHNTPNLESYNNQQVIMGYQSWQLIKSLKA